VSISNISVLILIAFASEVTGFGAGSDHLRPLFSPDLTLDPEYTPSNQYIASAHELDQSGFDTTAQPLLDGAQKFTKDAFVFPSLRFIRAVTRHRAAGDVLLTEWTIEEPFARGSVVLEDTPYVSLYEIRLRNLTIDTEADLANLLNYMFLREQKPTWLYSLTVSVRSTSGRPQLFRGRRTAPSTERPLIRDINLSGNRMGDDWYITVLIGKTLTSHYYPVSPFIPERFPALADIAKSLSFGRTLSELGHNPQSGYDINFSEYRDVVLATELARRGLTDEQVLQFLFEASPESLEKRAVLLVDGFVNAGHLDSIARILKVAVIRYESAGRTARRAVGTLFRAAADACSPEAEALAIDTLQRGSFPGPAAGYLGRCSTSSDVLSILQRTPLPEVDANTKQFILEELQKHIGKKP
jgi:hypothetical protein